MAYANCNWWKYSKDVYRIGRSVRWKPYTENEAASCTAFAAGIIAIRTWLAPRYRMVFGNTTGTIVNPEDLGKAIQLIGRSLKTVPPSEAEKELCDTLFQAIGAERIPGYTAPQIEEVEEEEEEPLNENEQ